MKKVYQRSLIAFLWNLICMLAAIFVVFLLAGYFLGTTAALITASVLAAFIFVSLYRQFQTRVVIEGNEIRFFVNRKVYQYQLDAVSIRAESVNSDSFTLDVSDSSGMRNSFDLSLLGTTAFHCLIEDIRQSRKESDIVKLNAVSRNTDKGGMV